MQRLRAGESEIAYATAGRAISISERSGDRELAAAGILLQGRALLQQRQLAQGLALLDEAMVCVRAGGLSPISTGRLYCSVIEGCVFAYIWERAAEWTEVLARWCDDQPDMLAFSGACRLHRAEVLELRGAWAEAIREATRACERGGSPQVVAAAYCQLGDIHRLRGELDEAERAYLKAGALGHQPQPGLALLRLAQGRSDAALAALRNAVAVAGQSGSAPGCSRPTSRRFWPAARSTKRVGSAPTSRRSPTAPRRTSCAHSPSMPEVPSSSPATARRRRWSRWVAPPRSGRACERRTERPARARR